MVVKKAVQIEIPAIKMGTATLEVVGTSPVIVHAWGVKAKRLMRDKQQQKATTKRAAKDPNADYFGAMYILNRDEHQPEDDQPDPEVAVSSAECLAIHGLPAAGFRKAIVRAARLMGAVMTDTRCGFKMLADNADNLLPMEFDSCKIREDVVRLNGTTSDLRYRPIYEGWSCKMVVSFMDNMVGIDQLVSLLKVAGRSVGVCEWRTEKDGTFGSFEVTGVSDVSYESV